MTELTYTKVGDYYLLNLIVGEQNTPPLGKYGCMCRTYLKEHSPVLLDAKTSENQRVFALACRIERRQ